MKISKIQKKKVLVYSQDPGGARFIAPIIKKIQNKHKLIVIAHPLSEAVFEEGGVAYRPIAEFLKGSAPDRIESFLLKEGIGRLFCTLSSPYRDMTNSEILRVSKRLNIPTFGVLDHWKGYDRFFDRRGRASYLPDFIGCIDGFCANRLSKFYKDPARIFILGHPYLETLLRLRKKRKPSAGRINIVIVSQPDTADRSFKGIFFKKTGRTRVIDKIAESIKNVGRKEGGFKTKYRAHPKEMKCGKLPRIIDIDMEKKWADTLDRNDIFIGLDSMLLVEAHLSGRRSILLKVPELSGTSDNSVPYNIGKEVRDLGDLENVLAESAFSLRNGYFSDDSKLDEILDGSLEKAVRHVERFINGEIKIK